MPQNFVACDRDQSFLLPPSLRDWVPAGHLVWTVLTAVEEMDLTAFYRVYRDDGHGRPAYDPSMMVALLLYSYARGNRSSRGIERECVEDVAYRVICANLTPDHSTIAEFRKRHETALAGLFGEVLSLCREAGLVSVGMIAIDGTKVHANASRFASVDYQQLARKILEEADQIDRERTSDTETLVVMSCPSNCRLPRGGGRRCGRRSAASRNEPPRLISSWTIAWNHRASHQSWIGRQWSATSRHGVGGSERLAISSMSSAASRPSRFRGPERRGCLRPSGECNRTWRSSAPRARGMTRGGRSGSPAV
jgi:transposase